MAARLLIGSFRSLSRVARLAVVALPLGVSCNSIMDIGAPEDPTGGTGGRGGNAGSERGGESGTAAGESGGNRPGGSGGMGGESGGDAPGAGGSGQGGSARGGVAGVGTGGASGTGDAAGIGGDAGEAGVGSGAGEAGLGGAAGDAGAGGAGSTGDCDPDAPFGAPFRLPINDEKARIFFARLTDDELTMVFQDIDLDIWIADRENTAEAFRSPRRVVEVSTYDYAEWTPTLTADGLTLFFQRVTDRAAVFVATRKHRADVFSGVSRVASLDDTTCPYITPNGQAMYLTSDMGRYAIFRAERVAGSFVFGPRVEYPKLGSPNEPFSPVVSGDELTIYFASTRVGGSGYQDIYRARRSTLNDAFGEAENVSQLNSVNDDVPTWISRDQCTIYMHRFVDGVGEEIFTATRTR